MPVLPEPAWFEIIPDWVCEILSSSTARLDKIVKMAIYVQLSAVHLRLIDPNQQTLEAYQLHNSHWLLIGSYDYDQAVSIAFNHAWWAFYILRKLCIGNCAQITAGMIKNLNPNVAGYRYLY